MPPRRAIRGRLARRIVEEQEFPNAPEVQPQEEVIHAEFFETIRYVKQRLIKLDKEKRNRVDDALIVSWAVFENAFMESFIPHELREAKIREFLTLNPETMSVHEYSLKFTQLYRYFPEMVVEIRSKISLFVAGLSRYPIKEGKAAMLIGDMDITRL
ncbi:uncharacterized protein LOC107003674 [Solanum pennellii]|uniref:Uncharacterized protein LOC107003674 n=1 Tax=Solanum pennellii TaxID=28526 RepID=A0ABM1FIV8_SOLPN|nr:uncharacterized protein LOC107003674 [Solanum pennellii]